MGEMVDKLYFTDTLVNKQICVKQKKAKGIIQHLFSLGRKRIGVYLYIYIYLRCVRVNS